MSVTASPLVLLTRPECGLCEEMSRALAALARRVPLPALIVRDVDEDALLSRRYGLKIPVLLLDGQAVCAGQLDEPQLLRALRDHALRAGLDRL